LKATTSSAALRLTAARKSVVPEDFGTAGADGARPLVITSSGDDAG